MAGATAASSRGGPVTGPPVGYDRRSGMVVAAHQPPRARYALALRDSPMFPVECLYSARHTPAMSKKQVTTRCQSVRKETESGIITLEVFLISGPMRAKFVKKNQTISRTILIRGKQTLQQLHEAIFDAFDREEEHMYEFQLGGKGPMDPKAKRYGPPVHGSLFSGEEPGEDASKTSIGALGLKVGATFGYWFDFGDDWWHQVNVVAMDDAVPPGKYPMVAKRVGQSPPQYADLEEP